MPIYKGRTKGTHRVVVWNRNQRHEWVVNGSKGDALAFEARKRVELDVRAKQVTRRAVTFSELCLDHYRPHAELHLKASTWRNVRRYQVATLVEFFGPTKLTDLSTEMVESYKRVRSSQVGKASSINNELRVMSAVLRFAREQTFPVAELKLKRLPERGDGRVKVWTTAQLKLLFDETQTRYPELLPMFVFLLNTGCRKGEAMAAEWEWMDFGAEMIRIPSNEYWQPKNGKPREVPMSNAVKAALAGPRKSSRWVFPNRHGDRYLEFPKNIFREIRTAAGLTGGAHTFRHTFASLFLQVQPDLFLLAEVLGHSQQRVTALYTHLLPDHLSRARNAVNLGPDLKTVAATVAKSRKPRQKKPKTG